MEEAQTMTQSTNGEGSNPNSWKPKTKFGAFLDNYFKISSRGSSILRELLGGLVIFLAMFYILPLNSNMLSGDWANIAGGNTANTKIIDGVLNILIYGDTWATVENVRAAVFAATAISAAVTTIIMGIFGKLPIGLASGLGINSLIAYTVMLGMGYSFSECLCLIFVDGLIFIIISATPLRKWIINSIPKSLKFAISAGIGFFITFIGFENIGLIEANSATLVTLGNFKNADGTVDVASIMGLVGVMLVLALTSISTKKKWAFWLSKFSVIISIVVMGIVCASLGQGGVSNMPTFYNEGYNISQIGNVGKLFGTCFLGFSVFRKPMAYALVFSLLFVDFFDTAGTLVGVEAGAGMVDEEGKIVVDDRPAMLTDAAGTCIGAICGTTTVTSFVESTTGVAAGARTGLAAVTTGLLFALSIAIYPALAMFSSSAVTGLALVYVGVCMFKNLEKIEWHDWVAVGSGFFTVIIMTLSYSISDGIAWGFLSYTLMNLVAGKFSKKDIPVAVCSAAFVVLYVVKFSTGLI